MRSPAVLLLIAVSVAMPTGAGPALAADKRNLLEDGASFEVGVDGFSLNNCYLLSHHGEEIVPVFDDSTAVHGKYSLRLDNPLGDKIVVAYRPIRLARSADVTVSGCLKGEGTVTVQLKRWPWETVAGVRVGLAKEWQRFSFPGRTESDQVYFLWLLPTVETKRVWVDALQIEEGSLGGFRPAALELSLATTAFCNSYKVGERCALVLRLYAETPPATIPVRLTVLDLFRNEVLAQTIDVPTHGQRHAQATIPLFRGDRRGSYKVIAEARLGDRMEDHDSQTNGQEVLTFGVLQPVPEPDPFFGFQFKHVFNEDAERRWTDNNAQRELVYANVDPSYVNRLARLVGAYSARCFRTAEWSRLEWPSGGYVWRDSYVDLMAQDGLRDPLVILNAAPSEWDRDPKLTGLGGKPLPRVDAWQDYVRATVRHYRGKVRSYEIVNEPETIFATAEQYVQYLKAAHDVIRAEDPEARIVAPSYSGRNPFAWIEAFGKAGGTKFVDIAAIHYAGRTLPEQGMDEKTRTWDLIGRYREILTRYNDGKELPIWDTEGGSFYWVPDYDAWPVPEQPDSRAEHQSVRDEPLAAAYAARLQLIEKACGVGRLCTFEFGFYYSQNASKARDLASMYVNFDGSPSPALVAYNAVAGVFGGTRPVVLLPLEHEVVATVFERQGKTVAALWKGAPIGEVSGFEKYDRPVWVDLRLAPEQLSPTNMLGHPLAPQAQGEGVRLVATAFPIYVTSDLPPAQVVEVLRAATLTPGPLPEVEAGYRELMSGRYSSAAIEVLGKLLDDSPDDPVLLSALGECLTSLNRPGEALKPLEKAVQLAPQSFEATVALARCYRQCAIAAVATGGHPIRQAVAVMENAIRMRPDDLQLRYEQMWNCNWINDVAGVVREADAAYAIDPNDWRTKAMQARKQALQASPQ